jgi:hypothetical protein
MKIKKISKTQVNMTKYNNNKRVVRRMRMHYDRISILADSDLD